VAPNVGDNVFLEFNLGGFGGHLSFLTGLAIIFPNLEYLSLSPCGLFGLQGITKSLRNANDSLIGLLQIRMLLINYESLWLPFPSESYQEALRYLLA
jgi:hypothetical protein